MVALDLSVFRDWATVHEHRDGLRREIEFAKQVGVRFVGDLNGVRLVPDDLDGDIHDGRNQVDGQKRSAGGL